MVIKTILDALKHMIPYFPVISFLFFLTAFLYISKLTLIIKNKIGYWQSKFIFYASIPFLQVFQESYRIVEDVILR